MKVLIAGFSTPDSFADNVAFSLAAMGHEPIVAPASLQPGRAARFLERGLHAADLPTPSRLESWVLRAAKAHHPQALIAPTSPISGGTLQELRRLGVRHRVAWWGDAPGNLRGMNLLSTEWDLVCVKDRATVDKLRLVGSEAMYLPEAMNPAWHRPVAGAKHGSVAVAGNYYGFRQYLIQQLTQGGVNFDLYGSKPPAWSLPEVVSQYRGRYIVREEKSLVFGEALACLNSTSFIEGNSINCRAFEVAGAAGLQLIEHKPIIEEFFQPGKELLVFKCLDECLAHIEMARRHPAEAVIIREAAARRALAHHTYVHRLKTLFSRLGES